MENHTCKCTPEMRSYACQDTRCIHNPNHECDDLGIVYVDQKGNEYKFRSYDDAEDFREKNKKALNLIMGASCCSICGLVGPTF